MAGNGRLNNLTLDELLNTPIKRLGLRIKGTACERGIKQLKKELKNIDIILDLNFYVSTEWGCDIGTSNIGIPFWELEPRLKRICKDLTGIQSYSDKFSSTMNALRHEAGHGFLYRNKVYCKRKFRRVFDVKGRFFYDYPYENNYKPPARVKWWKHVNPDPDGDDYAAINPDEDFAETFSVYLGMTERQWRRAYAKRNGAIEKLEYIDNLVKEFNGKKPRFPNNPHNVSEPANEITLTPAKFFEREKIDS